MELLRFITAGNVDDGKSTLIGRLLYDSKNILTDQLQALQKLSKNEAGDIDLALVTDGLRAERQQGITIDVAYKYFSTTKRKFIIADAPGHVQYTRNMVTGASNTDLIILLIDARNGATEQTHRHASLAALLAIPNVIIAINKLDLFNYSKEKFDTIKNSCEQMLAPIFPNAIHYIPISALRGDNILEPANSMSWYKGPSLLALLETIPLNKTENNNAACLPVQYVIKKSPDYRGYAGRLLSGKFDVNNEVIILPAGIRTTIKSIQKNSIDISTANAGDSISLQLADEIDTSRGDFIADVNNNYRISKELEATICWMDNTPLKKGNRYLLQLQSKRTQIIIQELISTIDMQRLQNQPAQIVSLNEIAHIKIKAASLIVNCSYKESKELGAFILIDETSNATVAAGILY